ncbi:MAG: ribosome small subunit-dependent GTPase A [Planctomycetaceae bacterium]|nr:ribosome small subunit-dependent GTPase A [Planctomycetaceae bacterium]
MSKKKRKVRAEFRKNRTPRARDKNWSQAVDPDADETADLVNRQSVTGKGELTRKRTVADAEIAEDDAGVTVLPAIDPETCRLGRVLRVQGLINLVQLDDGQIRQCATRRLLKTLATDQRHVVVAGDRVWVRPEGADEGIVERVEPRRGVLSRDSRGRQHIIAANVDQVLIVVSVAEPALKPHLVDRYLVAAERNGVTPIICLNKVDLVDRADLQPVVGTWAQYGYRVLQLSATREWGVDALRELLAGRETAVSGQSGVGKSSLLNALDPQLGLRVGHVSQENQKGRHTTTTAELIPLSCGGFVVDTPGIRQFQLWDVEPKELAGFFRDLRPYVSHCRYPNCTHDHEDECAVKDAVADGYLDLRRYESYLKMLANEPA